jgi:pimeloyl-ACP methyl ester carboxylesterase
VVFVHGAGGNISTWKYQLPFFKNHYNLLFIDLRGHGKSLSLENEEKYTFHSVANDIAEIMDHHRIEKAHMVGLSIGSLIIHKLCDLYPQRVISITGVGGIYRLTWKIHYFSKFAHILTRIFPSHLLYRMFAYIVMPRRNHSVSRKVFINASGKILKREYIRWLNLYGTFRSTVKELDLISQKKPLLIVMGSQDHLFLKPAEEFCSLHKEAQLEILKGCGHICNIEKPDLFNEVALRFLNHADEVE